MSRIEHIGDATLYLGDCREILPTLGKVDAVVTDPPYGLDRGKGTIGKRGRASRVTWRDTPEDVRQVYVPALVVALKLAGGIGIVTPGQVNMFLYPAPRDTGAIYQPCAIGVSPWGRATWQPILFYGDDPRRGKHLDPVTLVQNQPAEASAHPTPKPLAVCKWMVQRAARGGQIVLDPFMGSGTTGVAAIEMGRKFVGIEIDPAYFDIACRRIEQARRQPDMFRTAKTRQGGFVFAGSTALHPKGD